MFTQSGISLLAGDSPYVAGSLGLTALTVRNDVLAQLTDADGDLAPLQTDSDGALYVSVSGGSDINIDSNSIDTSGLVGKSAGGDFTTAWASATTITIGGLPAYHGTFLADDVVSVVQVATGGGVTATYHRDDVVMTQAGAVLTVTGATFANTDTFVIYTNIQRANGVLVDDTGLGVATDGVSVMAGFADDTAPDSVGEGDIGALRMSLDRVLYIQGPLAHSAVDSGNPIKIGARAASAQIAAVTAADRSDLISNLYGELVLANHTWATQSNRDEEIDPVDEHYLEIELVDDTNLGAATVYYPSATGQSMANLNNVSTHGVTSGGVTTTFEARIDDSTDWVDITPAGYRLDDNTTGNASFVDQTFMLDFDDLHVRHIRIKSVTADATNGVQYHWKLTAI